LAIAHERAWLLPCGGWLRSAGGAACILLPDEFATPSLRLIPKSEKPHTFGGLVVAPYEGTHGRMRRYDH